MNSEAVVKGDGYEIVEREFTVSFFNETRTLKAWAFKSTGALGTRYRATNAVVGRYRTGKELHRMDVEFETDPVEMERLPRFGWLRGDGFVYRITGHRQYGNWRSIVRPVCWAAQTVGQSS